LRRSSTGQLAASDSASGAGFRKVNGRELVATQDEIVELAEGVAAGNLDVEQILDPLQDDWTGTVSLEVFTDDWEYIRMSKDRLDTML